MSGAHLGLDPRPAERVGDALGARAGPSVELAELDGVRAGAVLDDARRRDDRRDRGEAADDGSDPRTRPMRWALSIPF